MINKDTKKLFSVASNPGNFGATIYNRLFRLLGINAVYLPIKAEKHQRFETVFRALKLIGAVGVNVSMPFKRDARCMSDNSPLHDNVNTLVKNKYGGWDGRNTDEVGTHAALSKLGLVNERWEMQSIKDAYIMGCGALSATVVETLHTINPDCLIVSGRSLPNQPFDLFVNCTPCGMPNVAYEHSWDDTVEKCKYVVDAVVSPPKQETNLVRQAKAKNKPVAEGHYICTHGLAMQFCYHFPEQIYDQVSDLVQQEVKDMGYEI